MFVKLFMLAAFVAISGADGPAAAPLTFFFPTTVQDLVVGTITAGDTVLTQFDVNEPFIFLKWYTITLTYPPAGTTSTAIIHYIKITDKIRNGYNGTPTIVSGGVGQTSVTIQIQSKFSGPVYFSIVIQGA